MAGFTKSYRDKWRHPIFRDLLEASVWSWMCDTAVWEDTRINYCGQVISLSRGQLITSRSFISKGFRIGEQSIRTLLARMENDGMINQQPTSHGTIITICNYSKYQDYQPATNQPTNQPPTSPQPATNQNKKELKEGKEGKELNKENFVKEKPEEETTHAQTNQPASPENHPPDAGANPVTPPAKPDKAEPVGFELFWKNFPNQRKGSRDRALRAYRLAIKRASAEKINLAVLQYAKSQEVRTGYAKGAAAWLNDDRYETDYSVNPKNGKRVETSRSESREVF